MLDIIRQAVAWTKRDFGNCEVCTSSLACGTLSVVAPVSNHACGSACVCSAVASTTSCQLRALQAEPGLRSMAALRRLWWLMLWCGHEQAALERGWSWMGILTAGRGSVSAGVLDYLARELAEEQVGRKAVSIGTCLGGLPCIILSPRKTGCTEQGWVRKHDMCPALQLK